MTETNGTNEAPKTADAWAQSRPGDRERNSRGLGEPRNSCFYQGLQRNIKIKRFLCFGTQIDLGPRLALGQSRNNRKRPVGKTKAERVELMVHPCSELTF